LHSRKVLRPRHPLLRHPSRPMGAAMETAVMRALKIGLNATMVDWTPFGSRELVARAGKFQIPLGSSTSSSTHPSVGRRSARVHGWTLDVCWALGVRQLESAEGATEPEDIGRQLVAATARFSPAKQWSLRVEVAVPLRPSGGTDRTSIGAMVTFVF
jgi:hypothetical protein